MLALPLRYREPVILYYFHEMDLSRAAATMRLPEGTMKARLSRARGRSCDDASRTSKPV